MSCSRWCVDCMFASRWLVSSCFARDDFLIFCFARDDFWFYVLLGLIWDFMFCSSCCLILCFTRDDGWVPALLRLTWDLHSSDHYKCRDAFSLANIQCHVLLEMMCRLYVCLEMIGEFLLCSNLLIFCFARDDFWSSRARHGTVCLLSWKHHGICSGQKSAKWLLM